MQIYELKYSNTNTYLIEGTSGYILFDTGWAGSFPAFCAAVGALHIPVQKISYILISHFHPDHMGIAQEIADLGPVIALADVQQNTTHAADEIFRKDPRMRFVPIRDERVKWFKMAGAEEDGRALLKEVGIDGDILYTPGHSDDSISLCLDDGSLFVGDLNPLYELEMHLGTQIEESWKKLLARSPRTIYYGHARTWHAEEQAGGAQPAPTEEAEDSAQGARRREGGRLYALTAQIMKMIDKGLSLERIRKKTGADPAFIEDVARMYLTHQNVGVQGILDRIEIKGK